MNREESILQKGNLGQSIEEVEELIRHHEDFLRSIESRSDDLDNVARLTAVSVLHFFFFCLSQSQISCCVCCAFSLTFTFNLFFIAVCYRLFILHFCEIIFKVIKW